MWQLIWGITPVTVALHLLGALAVGTGLALWEGRDPAGPWPRRTAGVLLAGWLALLLVATLAPVQPVGSGDATVWWLPGAELFDPGAPLLPDEAAVLVREQLTGAALYLPVPLLLRFAVARRSAAWAFGLSVALCVAVEAAQAVMRAGRIADVNDVLSGAAGAGLGLGLAALARWAAAVMRRAGPRRRAVRAAP
ncbi:VanZ family protein [Streptomyces catenulae]|uniref:VanZ family protein n=1 Tax=Streptomyces catenulae TaxID=66875 RepID=A0ABV2Z2W8_9ACTN|nr:VanZ family protein [Streptomyces catenulae]